MRDGKTLDFGRRVLQKNLLMDQLQLPAMPAPPPSGPQGVVQRGLEGTSLILGIELDRLEAVLADLQGSLQIGHGSDRALEHPAVLGGGRERESGDKEGEEERSRRHECPWCLQSPHFHSIKTARAARR
jgi:hypothetical protein